MDKLITGIHHITVLADDPQKNLDFYCGVLGLRLIKKTVNFDAPEVYHFYYGDETGQPGTILTFFPHKGITRGRRGKGMINTTGFSVPAESIGYWMERLKKFNIAFKGPVDRFEGETFIYFEDQDGVGLELVFNDADTRPGFTYGHIPPEHSVKGFYHAEIWADSEKPTAALLTGQMDHVLIAQKDNRYRYAATDAPGNYIDIIADPQSPRALKGGGSVDHIAFNTPNIETQLQAKEKITHQSLNPTHVYDRQYFKSIYFREPAGVLFEIATAGPGFQVDESKEHLGEGFKLPSWYEQYREQIEKAVIPITFNPEQYS